MPGGLFVRSSTTLVEKMEFGIERVLYLIDKTPSAMLGELDRVINIVDSTTLILNEMLRSPSIRAEYFQRNPKREISNLVDLLVNSRLSGESVEVVSPVCPDYDLGTYKLNNGVGDTAIKALNYFREISTMFERYHFPLKLRIDVADVEAYDESILRATGESTNSFLSKVNRTTELIRQESRARVIDVQVEPMSSRVGSGYIAGQLDNARSIAQAVDGPKAKVRDLLYQERKRGGDFAGIDDLLARLLVCYELGGYAEYGRNVGGKAIIASPDASSAIPAYNFEANHPSNFSPVIYIRK